MSRKPRRKPNPRPGTDTLVATKTAAAIGQLESAILLWFNEADPISILVLATNAENCFNAIGQKVGKPSFYASWLDSMPGSFQERARYIQDFAKHGFMDLEEAAPFSARYAEGLMLASCDCYKEIHGTDTFLIRLFEARFYFERPDLAPVERSEEFSKLGALYGFGGQSRKEFFEEYATPLREAYSARHDRSPL